MAKINLSVEIPENDYAYNFDTVLADVLSEVRKGVDAARLYGFASCGGSFDESADGSWSYVK